MVAGVKIWIWMLVSISNLAVQFHLTADCRGSGSMDFDHLSVSSRLSTLSGGLKIAIYDWKTERKKSSMFIEQMCPQTKLSPKIILSNIQGIPLHLLHIFWFLSKSEKCSETGKTRVFIYIKKYIYKQIHHHAPADDCHLYIFWSNGLAPSTLTTEGGSKSNNFDPA